MKSTTAMFFALFIMITPACVPTETRNCDGGHGGAGAGGDGGGTASFALECAADADCDQTWSGDCAATQCIDGFCKEQHLPPDYTCSDDLGAPGQCWGGQCCFTCLADLGDKLGAVDVSDGPCMAGNADTACGFGRKLCQDCTITGEVCDRGLCVAPQCVTNDDCEDYNECTVDYCNNGKCHHPTDTQSVSCDAGEGQCVVGTCQPNACLNAEDGSSCVLCDLDGVCVGGLCAQTEPGPPHCE